MAMKNRIFLFTATFLFTLIFFISLPRSEKNIHNSAFNRPIGVINGVTKGDTKGDIR